MPAIRIAALLVLAPVMTAAAPSATPLDGVWGAPGANVTLSADGGRLEQDCASGSFGAIRPDAQGRFEAKGRFEAYQPGPQQADVPSGVPAHFSGRTEGDMLHLTIRPDGGTPQTLMLTKGRRAKLIRCL